jgi:hypothetical protein
MNLVGTLILVALIVLVMGASRRVALLGMMAGVLFLTEYQSVLLLGLNLYAIRFLELAGFIRVVTRREFSFVSLNNVDKALVWLYGFASVVLLIRSSMGVASAIGGAVDAFLCYFTFRGLVRDLEDFSWFLRAFIFLLLPYTVLVLLESRTGHNPFAAFYGLPDVENWRRGRPRCIGSFRQPDLLGMFAASFIPLYVGLACISKERRIALSAIFLCLVIAWAANSGGPAGAAIVGLGCWGFWRIRTDMKRVRWSIVAIIAALAPVQADRCRLSSSRPMVA